MKFLKSKWLFACAVLTFSLSLGSGPAFAQGIEKLGTFKDWTGYRFTENGAKACYMATQPKKSEGNYTRRDPIFFLVTHRPSKNSRDVSSFVAGYNFKQGSTSSVSIGGKQFTLYTSGDTAWARDSDDRALVQAMIGGSNMVVKGTSSRGTLTTDTFSLFGFTDTYQTISRACDLNP